MPIALRFVHPELLVLLILAVLPLRWRSRRGGSWQLAAVLAAGVLVLADPVLIRRVAAETIVLYDLDRGGSAEAALAAHPGARLRTFNGAPDTALAETGAGLKNGGGTIHLYGGVNDPAGPVERTAQLLNRRGIPVYVHVLPRRAADRPELGVLRHPPVAGTNETVEIEAEVFFPDGRPATALLKDARGHVAAQGSAAATPGVRRFRLLLTPERPGEFTYTFEVAGVREKVPLRVDPPFRVLVFSKRAEEAKQIARLFAPGASVTLYDGQADPADCPLAVFGAGSVDGLPAGVLERVAEAAGRGAGVWFFAEKAPPFRPDKVPPEFSRLLPLVYRAATPERLPDTALVVIIDTSGSMSGSRLELAREVARLAADKLRDRDRCGILEFHGRRRWAAPLQSAGNRLELHRALNRLSSGGGTLILPALREAYYALRNTEARLKHVLVITDGGVERGDFESLIREMAKCDITVSTVMIGAGDSEFLASLALWGNGRFYRAANRFAVPELSFRHSGRDRKPPWREGELPVGVVRRTRLTEALPREMSVHGTMECEALPGSEVILTAGEFPLFARRAGCAVLNLALDGEWGERLLNAPEYRGMLAASARSLPDPVAMRRCDFRNLSRRRKLHVVIDGAKMPEKLHLRLTAPDGNMSRFVLAPEADGACRFRLANAAPGIHKVEVASDPGFADASAIRIVSRDAPRLLSDAGETAAAERIDRRSRRLAVPVAKYEEMPLRPLAGGLFILLMLAQLLWRRWPGNAAWSWCVSLLPMLLGAGEYETQLRRGLLGDGDRMASFRQAERVAATPADRKFARLLLLEAARDRKRLPEVLARFREEAAADPELLEPVVDELEDRGDFRNALRMLERHADTASVTVTRRMLHLAQQCGDRETEALQIRVRERLEREPESVQYLDAALRLELLTGRRDEAAKLLRQTIERSASPAFLTQAAECAEKLGLPDEAELALLRAEKLSPQDPWPYRFRRVALLRGCGKTARAVEALRTYAAEPKLPPTVKSATADRAEQLGDTETALRLYRECPTPEATIRRAMLLEGCGRYDEAAAAWLEVVRHADNDMRSLQAADRLIALELRRKRLGALCRKLAAMPELATELRLQRTYFRALAADGNRKELFAILDKRPDLWRTRLDFLLEFKLWSEAFQALSDRMAAHPEERETLLRQQAVIAVECGDVKTAELAVTELLKSSADRIGAAGFAAEVYMRLNDPVRAAELYAECLKLAPERFELHLLRANALKAAGRRDEALVFFRARLTEDLPPEKFCIAVDGLLNLEAPVEVLKSALDRVMKRIEVSPEQLLYYRLAEDLADELADVGLRRRLLLMQLAAAPERRELLLRELFEDARLRDDRKNAGYFARLLVGWNGVYPPELRRELGRALAGTPEGFAAAERSARSADDHAGSTHNLFMFVDSCLDLMRPADALRICRELLSLAPDDEAVLAKYAFVLELTGEFRMAGEVRERQFARHAGSRVSRNGREVPPTPEERRLVRAIAAHRVLFHAAPKASPDENAPGKVLRVLEKHAETALRRPPPEGSGAARSPKPAGPTPEATAAMLARHNDDRGAAELRKRFATLPANRRAPFFMRLLDALSVEPAPPVETALSELMDPLEFSDGGSFGASHLPIAAQLKKRVSARVLKRRPESFSALVMNAKSHWLCGETRSARLLVEEAFDQFLKLDAPTLPTLRRLRDACFVYSAFPGEDERAGAAARDSVLASLESDRKLLGDTPGRRLLAAVLLENADRVDAAFELLRSAWQSGQRDLATFKVLEELTLETGRFREFTALLEAHSPKDQMTEVLYRRRLIQLLRDTGRTGEALMQLPSLPEALQRRERLRIAAAAPDGRSYAWELRRFLLEEARDPRFSGYYNSDFGIGGMREKELRRRPLVPPTGTAASETAAAVEYLLLGTAVTDPAFSALLKLRREIGGRRCVEVAPEVTSTPGGTALRAVLEEELSPADRELLRRLCRSRAVSPDAAEQLLAAFSVDERPHAAEELAARMFAGKLAERELEVLERVLLQTDDAGRARLAAVAGRASGLGDPYRFRVAFDALLRRTGTTGTIPSGDRFIPPGSEWDLVASPLPFERRLADLFAAAARAPEWRDVIPLLDAGTRKNLPETVEKATAEALHRRFITRTEAVKSFSLLAAADPERKAHWLKLAVRYDTPLGEASLWRLDALDGAEKRELAERLRHAGRLPPAREPDSDPPNHQHKE